MLTFRHLVFGVRRGVSVNKLQNLHCLFEKVTNKSTNKFKSNVLLY